VCGIEVVQHVTDPVLAGKSQQWACRGGAAREPGEAPRRRLRATYHRTGGVRHLFAAMELGTDKMYGHMKKRKRRGEFLEFCRYVRSLHPAEVRIAIICDNFSPHLSTRKDKRVGAWAAASNAEIAYTPKNCSWMNRIECQFTALREFTLNWLGRLELGPLGRLEVAPP
jgi:hypothetical protein